MLTAQQREAIRALPDATHPLDVRIAWGTFLLKHLGFDESGLDLFTAKLARVDGLAKGHIDTKNMQIQFTDGRVVKFIKTILSHTFWAKQVKVYTQDTELIHLLAAPILFVVGEELERFCVASRKDTESYTPMDIENWHLAQVKLMCEQLCPLLWAILRAISADHTPPGKSQQTQRDKPMMVSVAIAILAFTRTRRANKFQAQLGYCMLSYHVGKRPITVLNALGLTVGHDTLNAISKSIGDACKANLEKMCSIGAPVLNFDNMDYTVGVKTDSINKSNFLRHDTIGFVYFPDGLNENARRDFVSASAIKTELVPTLSPYDIVPTQEHIEFLRNASHVHILSVLSKYHPAVGKLFKNKGKPNIPDVQKLELRKTPIFPLPALPLNEAKTSEILQIVDKYLDEIGVDEKRLEGKKIVTKGDLRTNNTLKSGINQRQDCRNAKDRLEFIEVLPSLFHMEYAMSKLLNDVHWGSDTGRDPGSIGRFVKITQNNKVKREGKDFRSTTLLQSDILDAYSIAAIYSLCNVKTEDEFDRFIKENPDFDIAQAAKDVAKEVFDLTAPRERRYTSNRKSKPTDSEERDVIQENALILMKDFLCMREFRHATRQGDVGRIVHVLLVWCVLFQGSKCTKYAAALIEIAAGLTKLWDKEFRDHFLNGLLVNPSGMKGKWIADDMFCEWLVREFKDLVKARVFTNGLSLYLRVNMTRQISIMQMNRMKWITETKSVDYGRHSSEAKRENQVRFFVREIISAGVFSFTPRRRQGLIGGQIFAYTSTTDLWNIGMQRVFGGIGLGKFKRRYKGAWRTFYSVALQNQHQCEEDDSEEDDEDDSLDQRTALDSEEETDDIIEEDGGYLD